MQAILALLHRPCGRLRRFDAHSCDAKATLAKNDETASVAYCDKGPAATSV
jgi:hypothetical protein